jgi:hypothetical protein
LLTNYRLCLSRAVTQLAWQPECYATLQEEEQERMDEKGEHRLAIAGEDSSLKIITLKFKGI